MIARGYRDASFQEKMLYAKWKNFYVRGDIDSGLRSARVRIKFGFRIFLNFVNNT